MPKVDAPSILVSQLYPVSEPDQQAVQHIFIDGRVNVTIYQDDSEHNQIVILTQLPPKYVLATCIEASLQAQDAVISEQAQGSAAILLRRNLNAAFPNIT